MGIVEISYDIPLVDKLKSAYVANYVCDVFIPYHDANRKWLEQSIESMLNQQSVRTILHVVADGTENSKELISRFPYKNIRWYNTSRSLGPYVISNLLFPSCESDCIAIQDSDDISLPHRLAYSIYELKKSNASMFGGAMLQFDSYDQIEKVDGFVNRSPIHRSGLLGWSLSPNGVIINGVRVMSAEMFGRLNGFRGLLIAADCEFTTRAIRAFENVVWSDEILSLRRVHTASLSNDRKTALRSEICNKDHAVILESYKSMHGLFDPREYGTMISDQREYGGLINVQNS